MTSNPWRFCNTDPPQQYVRVEIKGRDKKRYIGYRYKNTYYETIGNYVIEKPHKWRYIPVGSYLWNEIAEKIHRLSSGYGEEEVAFDRVSE